MVIGGGVAGMEAGRVAALRGHKVVIYEKSDELGGHVREAISMPFKAGEQSFWIGIEPSLGILRLRFA